MRKSIEERFWDKIDKTSGCWLWKASTWGGKEGYRYGQFKIGVKGHYAHRFAYELIKGKIPKGLDIDHLCRNRLCCNPAHLEAVTRQENLLRGEGITAQNAQKTHCKRGHEFTLENTNTGTKFRRCNICIKKYMASYHKKRMAGAKRSGHLST